MCRRIHNCIHTNEQTRVKKKIYIYIKSTHRQVLFIILIIIITPWEFFSKSPQVSRTLLSILAVLNNAVVWMDSTPVISKSSSPFNNPLVTVPKAPITIGIIDTFNFYSFFNFLARSRYLSFFSLSFSFILWLAGTAKSTILQVLSFFFFFFW